MRNVLSAIVALVLLGTPFLASAHEIGMSTQGFEYVTMRGKGMYIKRQSRRVLLVAMRESQEIREYGYYQL